MNNNPIGIFDSGIGGLSILKTLLEVLPKENYVYYADSVNNPYGSKTSKELCEITSNIVQYLLNKNCKIIVVACNTATTVCIKYLRDKYKDVLFIGTVPAVKIAYDHNSKNTLVLATPYTMKTKRLYELVTAYKHKDQNIKLVSCNNLANTIEYHEDKVDEVLDSILFPYKEERFDAIVLGCTHYSIIKDKFRKYFNTSEILDGNMGVAKETKRQLELNNLLTSTEGGNIEFYNSDINNKVAPEEVLKKIEASS